MELGYGIEVRNRGMGTRKANGKVKVKQRIFNCGFKAIFLTWVTFFDLSLTLFRPDKSGRSPGLLIHFSYIGLTDVTKDASRIDFLDYWNMN
jgi:hypothetical protein